MTAPSDQDTAPQTREEPQEIVLRLGDILPRIPSHLIRPGQHDPAAPVRFSVDELAEKIARGRVSVPLDRLASVYPDVFRGRNSFTDEQEVPLPLQKLLEQVGLVSRKSPASNGVPPDQIAQARATAALILESAAAQSAPAVNAETPAPSASEPPPPAEDPSQKPQKKSNWRLLDIFARSPEPKKPEPSPPGEAAPPQPAALISPTPSVPSTPPIASIEPTPGEPTEPVLPEPSEPIPSNPISLRLLPIFRLLPASILRPGALPADDIRATFPLSAIDSQLVTGHVEIPLDDFIKALPEPLRETLNPIPAAQVWIPLDEIFQSLPPTHLFHMPAQTPPPEPAPEPPPPQPDPIADISAKKSPADPSPTTPPQPRTPWMLGFQGPPPKLLGTETTPAESPTSSTPTDPTPTPEAKRTVDFLATQPGVFAAAAFVQGAAFASADFPRKPDLDALRDFMGSFVDHTHESGQRLGWNRVLTIACEQFHATAVVRESHFIVALHHDRVLSSVAHDALIAAADDLSKASTAP